MIQSILFDRFIFNLQDAKRWLKQHNFKDDVDIKQLHYRFRQIKPDRKKYKYITKEITDGIEFIIGIEK